MFDSVCQIYFSPTGTTKAIVEAIAVGLGCARETKIDLTKKGFVPAFPCAPENVAILGAPVYSGRLPETMIARMEGIEGRGMPAVLVVVYGNRDYDDALLELKDIAERKGFKVAAAAAFVGEHSLSTKERPIAEGRPDALDIARAVELGGRVRQALESGGGRGEGIAVPGNLPYKARKPKAVITLITDQARCVACGICWTICPIDAIPEGKPLQTDGEKCIRCAACIKACPEHARSLADPTSLEIAQRLYENCKVRREPVLFL